MRVLTATSTFVLFVIGACSSSSSSGSPDQACGDLASSVCTKLQTCAPFLLQAQFGDVATCQSRQKLNCMPLFGVNGSGLTPDNGEACAQAYGSISCDELFADASPVACQSIHGTLAAGVACGTDSQCAGDNSYCKLAAGQTCGVCGTRAAAGAACSVTKDCTRGLACVGGTCTIRGDAGATCDATHPCKGSLACNKGTCATPLAAGSTCDGTADACDTAHGAFCDSQANICKTITIATAGAQCGVVNGGAVICPGSLGFAGCKGFSPPATTTGTCVASAADGASCDATSGAQCQAPATCVNGSCKLIDPAACR